MKDLRIAAVVCRCPVGATDENLDRVDYWAAQAQSESVDLICFPEMNVSGYSAGPKIRSIAEPISGPIVGRLEKTAVKYGLVILAGMAESTPSGQLHVSQLVVSPGCSPGVYRKVHVSPPEGHLFASGNTVPLFAIGGVRFGIQLCYDAHFPELTTRMATAGADVIFIPHASPRGTAVQKFKSWMRHLPARAYDNGIFVVACNQTGDNGGGHNFPGVAMVIGPSGEIVAKRVSDEEGMIVTCLSARKVERVRGHRMRYFLPNRRPEIYHLGCRGPEGSGS